MQVTSLAMKEANRVPYGSILGPLLFLLYINDLSGNITSKIRLLYTDNIILHREIPTEEDVIIL